MDTKETKLIFTLDGYIVAERLLEGVDFEVEVLNHNGEYSIGEISPVKSAESYLASIRWENYLPALRSIAEFNLDHTVKWCEDKGTSLELEMEQFEAETGIPGPQLLAEV